MSKKAMLAVATLASGLGLLAMIAQIQRDPFTLTSWSDATAQPPVQATSAGFDPAKLALDSVRAALGPAQAVTSRGVETARVSQGPSSSNVEPGAKSQPAAAAQQEGNLVPCSPWRDLGPKLGNIEGEAASRSVRQLC
jgi:hypothetical protein